MIRSVIAGFGFVVVALVTLGTATAASQGTAVGTFVSPVHGAVITQGFGCTAFTAEPLDPRCPGGHWHSGVDLAAAAGTAVHATAPGRVLILDSPFGYGLHIILDHGDGLTSLYGHLSAVSVGDGDVVAAGDVIGAVGSTGNSTGPHLHFEIRRDGIAEDPRDDLALP